MNRFLWACLTAIAFTAAPELEAQSLQAKLEVNLGPIAIDLYNGTSQNNSGLIASGPDIPACGWGAGSNYRTCMQSVLSSYSQQGVTGVRVQFSMNGEALSTPFLNQSGALSPTWLANLSLFFEDLRAANMRYVSLSPAWGTWGTGNMTMYACVSGSDGAYSYNFSCTSANANAVFYPWLPWALSYSPSGGQGGPYAAAGLQDYDYVPQLGALTPSHQPWAWNSSPPSGWSPSNACSVNSGPPLFNFFDCIFKAVGGAELSLRELDLFPELAIHASSVYGRLVYDNVQLVHPLDSINQIMQLDGLGATTTVSTASYQPLDDGGCTSPYQNFSNSGLVLDAFLLLSAQSGGQFGQVPGVFSGNYCDNISSMDMIPGQPVGQPLAVLDVHVYPADYVLDNGWGWISDPNYSGPQNYPDGAPVTNSPSGCVGSGCTGNASRDVDAGNSSASSETAANMIYGAVSTFAGFWSGIAINPNVPIIIGETDQYNPGGTGQGGNYFPATTEGTNCTTYGIYGSILDDQYTDPGTGVVHNVNFWCTPDWKWHRPWSAVSAFENTAGFSQTGLNKSSVVMRPWAPVSWGTVLTPAPLSGGTNLPYNVGGCQLAITGYSQPVPSAGGPLTLGVASSGTSACQWSIGPASPQQPSPGTLTWSSGTSGIVTSASINNGPNCTYPAQGTSNCWGTGTASVTFQIAPNQTQAQQSFMLNVAGFNLPFTQLPGEPTVGPPSVDIDAPAQGAVVLPGTVTITGWALDNVSAIGTAISSVQVEVDGNLVGNATYGTLRQDVCNALPGRPGCPNVGYTYSLNTSGLSPGTHTITVLASDSDTPPLTGSASVTITLAASSSGAGPQNFKQIGVFRNALSGSTAGFVLDSSGTNNYVPSDKTAFFGLPGDMPVAGDFFGTGVIEIGVFRCPAAGAGVCQWYIDANNNGVWDSGDLTWSFGLAGDIPVVGDWKGDGTSRIGVFRCPAAGVAGACTWILDAGDKHSYDPVTAVTGSYGLPGDIPVVNNWNGSGTVDQIGVYRNGTWIVDSNGDYAWEPSDAQYSYGLTGDKPVVGNWNGTGRKRIGVFRSSGGYWVLNASGSNAYSPSDPIGYFGLPGDLPVVGLWTMP